MNHYAYTRLFISLTVLSALLGFVSCSDSDSDDSSSESSNRNKNNTETNAAYGRLEFPKIKNSGRNIVIIHDTQDRYGINYSVEWDMDKQSQRWSCYQMYAGNRTTHTSRYYGDPQYPFDPAISSETYFNGTDPFWHSGFDHGHICPSADRLYSKDANYQTFYLTNMQPQYNVFNAGVWAHMEDYMRSKIGSGSTGDTLFICKGGTIDNANQILMTLENGLIVPKYFFMAALRKKSKDWSNIGAMGFYIEQSKWDNYARNSNNTKYDLTPYVVNIDKLEELTGIDFFCNLPDDVEETIESKPREFIISVWGPMTSPNLGISK